MRNYSLDYLLNDFFYQFLNNFAELLLSKINVWHILYINSFLKIFFGIVRWEYTHVHCILNAFYLNLVVIVYIAFYRFSKSVRGYKVAGALGMNNQIQLDVKNTI